MILGEFLKYRDDLLDQAKDDEGFIQESILLSQILPSLVESKLLDSEDFNNSYFKSTNENLKVNAYCVNESGERLQLFIVDEATIELNKQFEELQVSLKSTYESQFKRTVNFIKRAVNKYLSDEIQDSHPARALISHISSPEGLHQFDVIEIFLITMTSTISLQSQKPQPKRIEFESESIQVSFPKERTTVTKEIIIKKRLIDLNFLFNVLVSQGNREALVVDFEQMFGKGIPAIKAADESNFESYLCVLPAEILAKLYLEFSSRLLEKNVRSFLQFRGVNQGIRDTIRKEPEKFVAYNNGVTITATSGEIVHENNQDVIKSLVDFQIVNGGQTTATIYFTKKDGFDISKIKVMAKINVAKSGSEEELEELISNISTYSNAQSKVSKVDLRSRNPQLIKLKALSESVITPSGQKWFFERSKGEFNTMVRVAGSNKNRVLRDYPPNRRFSKEQLAKYFTAWGEIPHVVKKGGEKVFRYFIEELSGEGKSKKGIEINRLFYEELIAKILLFTELEKMYGQGKNSMGQIRAATVPYTLSLVYKFTDGSKASDNFDLVKIWLNEGLDNDLKTLFYELLSLVNSLIKKYSKSDDLGEYSKKEELWNDISNSNEIKSFISQSYVLETLKKYAISKKEYERRYLAEVKTKDVDFDQLTKNVSIFANSKEYYKQLKLKASRYLSEKEIRKIDSIIHAINEKRDLDIELLDFENTLLSRMRFEVTEIIDELNDIPKQDFLFDGLNNITKTFNIAKEKKIDIQSEFEKQRTICEVKKVPYASIFSEIGKKLSKGDAPSILELIHSSEKYRLK
jgi:hypothetical protein